LGSSHAIALTWATSSGGKTARATRPRLIYKTIQAIGCESSPPLTNHLGAHLKPSGDLSVRQAISGVEHKLCPLHIAVGQRQLRRAPLKL
jgi:hypothetical protein